MCQLLSQLREAIKQIAEGFDPELLAPSSAQTVLDDALAIEHMAATIKVLAATRVAAGGTWRDHGQRSAAEDLARRGGMSVGAARDSLQTGRCLLEHSELAAAARQGQLSTAQSIMIADAVSVDPRSTGPLLAHAVNASLSQLRDECARVKTAACPDLERRRAQIHTHRKLRAWSDLEGIWHLHASGNPEHGAQIMSALSPIADQLFDQARTAHRRQSPDAYRFDALVQLGGGHQPLSAGPPSARRTVSVRT